MEEIQGFQEGIKNKVTSKSRSKQTAPLKNFVITV